MTFAANANVNAAVPRGRDIMPVAEREAFHSWDLMHIEYYIPCDIVDCRVIREL